MRYFLWFIDDNVVDSSPGCFRFNAWVTDAGHVNSRFSLFMFGLLLPFSNPSTAT